MNTDYISDLPDWDDERLSFNNEEKESWKPNPTLDACKALYRQWQEIMFLLQGVLMPIIDDDNNPNDFSKQSAHILIGDAYVVGTNIRSSEAGDIYVIRMGNAAIIRELAQSITSSLLLFAEDDAADKNYIEIIRKEIEKFRTLFIQWVNTFEKDEYRDDWGLFV